MSNLSNFLDVLAQRLEAIYTHGNGYFLLPNPYKLEGTSDLKLAKGYGIKLEGGNPPNIQQIGCVIEIDRSITIVNTRKSISVENDRMRIFEAEKALLEDQRLLLVELANNWDLYYANENKITSMDYVGDSGIVPVFPERSDMIKIETNFKLNYEESL